MKVLNVFGIILAWIVSIVLVLWLIVTPIAASFLSILTPETITNTVSSVITSLMNAPSAAVEEGFAPVNAGTEGAQITLLADGDNTSTTGVPSGLDISLINPDMIKDMFGVEVEEEALADIMEEALTSNLVNDLLGAYTEDLTNVISGSATESTFDSETIKEIVNENIDEIVDFVQKVSPESIEISKEELKEQIQTAVDENIDEIAGGIVEALPKAEDIKEEIVSSNPAIEILFTILAKRTEIVWAMVGVAAVCAILIFFLRFPGFRGLRWLAVDLFVSGGIGVLLSVGLKVLITKIPELMEGEAVMAAGVINTIATVLTNGMLWRTIVIVVVGGASLAGYIILKKFRNKKSVLAEMTEELIALEEEQTAAEEV